MTTIHHTCIALAAIAATGISAAQPVATSPVLFSSTNDFVPAIFAADGKSKLLFAAVEPDGSANIEIQDGDLRPCRDFSIAAHPEAATSVTTRNRKFTMPDGTRLLEREAIPLDSALAYSENRFGTIPYISSQDNGSIIICRDINGYIGNEHYFIFIPEGGGIGNLFDVHFDYYGGGGSWGSDWAEEYSWTKYRYAPFAPMNILDYDNGAASMAGIVATQTLFNNDEDYEYIVPEYQRYVIREATNDRRTYTEYGSLIKGFSIKSENGTTIQTIDFDKGLTAAAGSNFMSLLLIGEARYLSCYVCDTATGGRYNILYRIDTQGGSGIQQEGAPRKTRVYPTAVTAGDNIRIEAQGRKASFLIHDTNGNRLYSGSTQGGEAPATVPASALSKGINIVTVSTPGAETESTKVIVR